MPQTDENISF